ncbi:MAG: hypothetical protein H7070_12310 [Saprospiraceae bacterium]|nr:hypothetical protein [Pyrinomonadaceae bacterium]
MEILENQARQQLPPDMQTTEAIEAYYDGAVCLACDFASIGIAFLSICLGAILLLLWGIYELFFASGHSSTERAMKLLPRD